MWRIWYKSREDGAPRKWIRSVHGFYNYDEARINAEEQDLSYPSLTHIVRSEGVDPNIEQRRYGVFYWRRSDGALQESSSSLFTGGFNTVMQANEAIHQYYLRYPNMKGRLFAKKYDAKEPKNAAESPSNTFWYVFCPQQGQPKVKQPNHSKALSEARRLSQLNPGKEFFVLQAVNRVCSKAVVTTSEVKYG